MVLMRVIKERRMLYPVGGKRSKQKKDMHGFETPKISKGKRLFKFLFPQAHGLHLNLGLLALVGYNIGKIIKILYAMCLFIPRE